MDIIGRISYVRSIYITVYKLDNHLKNILYNLPHSKLGGKGCPHFQSACRNSKAATLQPTTRTVL